MYGRNWKHWLKPAARIILYRVPTNPWVSKSSQGTLFFVGSTSTSIVVAADGLVTDEGVPIGTTKKLMPLGNVGECFIGGDSRIGSGKGEVDLEKTVTLAFLSNLWLIFVYDPSPQLTSVVIQRDQRCQTA